jgi:hypothetical protein
MEKTMRIRDGRDPPMIVAPSSSFDDRMVRVGRLYLQM